MKPPDKATSFTTSRPVAVLMLFVAAVVFGWFSYKRLSVQLMPELSYPTITVRTEYAGAAPEQVEKDVSRPVEEALGVISGLRRISSVSRAGVSDVILEFAWDTEMSSAVQDTLEKLDLVLLPEEAGASLILRFDPSLDPVMELSLSSPPKETSEESEQELRRLRRIGELQIKRALEPIKGVAAVRVRGGLEEEIHVLVDSTSLTRAGISIGTVISRLEQENINVAGGTIKEGRADYMVRTLNEYQSLGEISATVLTNIDNRELRIRDVGKVVASHRERDMITRTNGHESVQIDIFKEADANMVELSKSVRQALGPLAAETTEPNESQPAAGGMRLNGLVQQLYDAEGVRLEVVADRSLFIESSINEVRNTAILGGLLAVLVLFLFLVNAKSTVIIGVSIPISLIVTFAPLNLMGVSLNIMSLGGLALGIGMLVDSSIVVLESIYRNREEGLDIVTATVRGTADVRGAVIASTLTTIGVFLPMVFVEGVAGQAFGDLGAAVVISLIVSLVVALALIPMLASRGSINFDSGVHKPIVDLHFSSPHRFMDDWRSNRFLLPYLVPRLIVAMIIEVVGKLLLLIIAAPVYLTSRALAPVVSLGLRALLWLPVKTVDVLLRGTNAAYPRLLRWSINHIGAVLLMVAGCLGLTWVAASSLSSELLPEVHQGEFTIEVALPVGTPIEATEQILAPVEQAILANRDQIETLIVTYGYDATNSQRSDEGEHTARFKVLLTDSSDNAHTEQVVADRIRARLQSIPDLDARLVRPVLFSFKTPIEVEIYGDDLIRLRGFADRVQGELSAMSQLTDVESSLRKGAPEVQIVYNRDQLRRYGLNVQDVANRVRDEVKGRTATKFNRRDRRVPIVVRLAERDRESVQEVKNLVVDAEKSGTIRLAAVAEVSLGEGPSEVRRVDGQRVAIVRANIAPGASLGSAVAALEARLQGRIAWPSDISFHVAGQNEEWERSQGSLWLALGLSIFLVYVIMAAQFESLLYPLIIMFTIPLAFFGSFLTLQVLHINLSIVVFLGMIMLAGIVVNNAIVLVDYINTLKRRGAELTEAVTQAGAVRLRPILMTTTTTALGLLPMALGLGDGAEIRTPLAITVISGLIVSTALTLLVIPTMYVLVDRAKARVADLIKQPEPQAAAEEPQ